MLTDGRASKVCIGISLELFSFVHGSRLVRDVTFALRPRVEAEEQRYSGDVRTTPGLLVGDVVDVSFDVGRFLLAEPANICCRFLCALLLCLFHPPRLKLCEWLDCQA